MTQKLTEHSLSIKGPNNHPWAVLTFRSRARDGANKPIFLSSDHIEGKVKLILDAPKKIKKISVRVSNPFSLYCYAV